MSNLLKSYFSKEGSILYTLLFLVMTGILVLSFSLPADAQPHNIDSPAEKAWHKCAETAFKSFDAKMNNNKQEAQAMFCQFIQMPDGPVCMNRMRGLAQVGILERVIMEFYYTKGIVPTCGHHPQR